MLKPITTTSELILEMKHGSVLMPPILDRKFYRLVRSDQTFSSVRRSVAESVLNDMRFRHVNENGSYFYQAMNDGH